MPGLSEGTSAENTGRTDYAHSTGVLGPAAVPLRDCNRSACPALPFMRQLLLFFCLLAARATLLADERPAPPSQPAAGPGGSDYPHAAVRESKHGSGGTAYHLFEPDRPVPESAPVIVFLHGWTAMDPWLYGAWINHLARRGNIVIHARYQESALTPTEDFTSNTVTAVKAALEEMERPGRVKPDKSRFAIAGHSVGGLLTANLAALATECHLPLPRALMSVQPGRSARGQRGFGVKMEDLSKLPKDALLLCLTGERDRVCGDTDAIRILTESTSIPAGRKNHIVLTTDTHGRPALTGSHLGPCSVPADPPDALIATGTVKEPDIATMFAAAAGNFTPARAFLGTPEGRQWRRDKLSATSIAETFDPSNAQDFAIWRLFDALCEAAFTGKVTVDALGMSPRSLEMGKWSDGTPVKPMRSGGK